MMFAFRADVEMLLQHGPGNGPWRSWTFGGSGPETLRLTILSFLGAGAASWTSASPRLGFKYGRSFAFVFMNIRDCDH